MELKSHATTFVFFEKKKYVQTYRHTLILLNNGKQVLT